jgi:hypothetical protein
MQLLAHPTTPAGPVSAIETDARCDGVSLRLSWRLRADLGRLRLPPIAAPERSDGLWRHTCFEAFIAAQAAVGYYELNFSPSGAWAAYRFVGYRAGMAPAAIAAPEAYWRRDAAALELDATLRVADLGAGPVASPVRIGLAAVIEDGSGNLSYWALRHPQGKPDFHHPDGFVLVLAGGAPASEAGTI